MEKKDFVPDIRKNWTLSMVSMNGKISFMWRADDGNFGHGWVNKGNLTPAEAAREWAEGIELAPEYKKLYGEGGEEEAPAEERDAEEEKAKEILTAIALAKMLSKGNDERERALDGLEKTIKEVQAAGNPMEKIAAIKKVLDAAEWLAEVE